MPATAGKAHSSGRDYLLSWIDVGRIRYATRWRAKRSTSSQSAMRLRSPAGSIWGYEQSSSLSEMVDYLRRRVAKPDVASPGQLKKRAGRKLGSSALCRPRTISSATTGPRNGDIVTPLWVMAIS
jgi:hypothetical protein